MLAKTIAGFRFTACIKASAQYDLPGVAGCLLDTTLYKLNLCWLMLANDVMLRFVVINNSLPWTLT